MNTEKLLYTDGHKITVTDSTFKVNKSLYHLKGIIRHDFRVIPPRRIPVLVMLTLGLVFLALGVFNLTPVNVIQNLQVGEYLLTARLLSLIFGAMLFLASIIFLIIEKERYGVQIVTAEGEKEVIVSKERAYIAMIHEALSKALEKWRF
jgi:hypothetical protein